MRVLKLTILLEPGMSIAKLANVFGNYITLGREHRFIEFTFPSVNMLSAKHLEPIYDLLRTYENGETLAYKMFYLYDAATDTHSPIAIHCDEGKWFTVAGSTGVESNISDNLFSLF